MEQKKILSEKIFRFTLKKYLFLFYTEKDQQLNVDLLKNVKKFIEDNIDYYIKIHNTKIFILSQMKTATRYLTKTLIQSGKFDDLIIKSHYIDFNNKKGVIEFLKKSNYEEYSKCLKIANEIEHDIFDIITPFVKKFEIFHNYYLNYGIIESESLEYIVTIYRDPVERLRSNIYFNNRIGLFTEIETNKCMLLDYDKWENTNMLNITEKHKKLKSKQIYMNMYNIDNDINNFFGIKPISNRNSSNSKDYKYKETTESIKFTKKMLDILYNNNLTRMFLTTEEIENKKKEYYSEEGYDNLEYITSMPELFDLKTRIINLSDIEFDDNFLCIKNLDYITPEILKVAYVKNMILKNDYSYQIIELLIKNGVCGIIEGYPSINIDQINFLNNTYKEMLTFNIPNYLEDFENYFMMQNNIKINFKHNDISLTNIHLMNVIVNVIQLMYKYKKEILIYNVKFNNELKIIYFSINNIDIEIKLELGDALIDIPEIIILQSEKKLVLSFDLFSRKKHLKFLIKEFKNIKIDEINECVFQYLNLITYINNNKTIKGDI